MLVSVEWLWEREASSSCLSEHCEHLRLIALYKNGHSNISAVPYSFRTFITLLIKKWSLTVVPSKGDCTW